MVAMAVSFSEAWAALDPAVVRSLELAHQSLVAGGLAVGSVITDEQGRIVAEGRNRAYDPSTGLDPLEATPLAHAEMNALARLATDADTGQLTIWSTQQPCSMCAAAIDFVGIGRVHTVATDPSDPTHHVTEVLDDSWVLLATVMFLIGPIRRGGPHHPIVLANELHEPEAVQFAQRAASTENHPLTDGRPLAEAVERMWTDLQPAALARHQRRRG